MKKKIKDLTDEELDKLCMSYTKLCPKECKFKLDDKGRFILSCKLLNPKYQEELVEVEE